mmetsp:Transcript_1681/g.2551  ORF Transcript_1681/g.2551 Transcript_1681/m.2551 type:complete len:389 (-) Transcript_1681:100-1266(-)|eukprot:CAMPEP_0194224518 /NCGR_PEP_ID=MMETSP0156-20130528/37683_1 /TAXON_ID=33649 /ORGANISM="Thalassionema nitzschioides, Strain L26-B" /LENGTH=388 /DNA_ID=CAMNT_0038956125 /DNA_START=345 /DNA_END=1511 /DNA_ORIENTATION=-
MHGVLAMLAALATVVAASDDACAELTRLSERVDTTIKYDGDDDGAAFVFAGNRDKSLYKKRCQYEPCDYTFDCVIELGYLELNEISDGGPLQVSDIRPSTNRLEGPLDSLGWSWPATTSGAPMLPRDALAGLKVHTPGKSNVAPAIQAEYNSWKYFYQEKGRTQIFRLTAGAYNVRNANRGMSAGRVEAYSDDYTWRYRNTGNQNKWYQFQALYTIVDPQDAHIFQVFSSDTRNGKVMAWTVTLSMLADGRIVYLERGHGISNDDCVEYCDSGQRLTVKRVTDITLGRGGQFALCVRDDGFVTETWALHGDALHGSAGAACGEGPWQLLGRYEGDARRRQNDAYDWKYRWGTYVQSKKTLEPSVVNACTDSLVFVSGVNMKKVLKAPN